VFTAIEGGLREIMAWIATTAKREESPISTRLDLTAARGAAVSPARKLLLNSEAEVQLNKI
jgi:hypothetical protein